MGSPRKNLAETRKNSGLVLPKYLPRSVATTAFQHCWSFQ
jgi:hypothetical protein